MTISILQVQMRISLGEAYSVNPIGVDFDPEELIRRMEADEPLERLIQRPKSGPRGPEDVPE